MPTIAPQARPWLNRGLPRRLLVGVAGVTVAAAGAYAYSDGLIGNRTSAPTYATAAVSHGPVRVSVGATGPIADPTSVPPTFKSAGKLAEIDVAVGDHVAAGQVLAREDPTDLQAALDQDQVSVQNAQKALDDANASLSATQQSVDQSNQSDAVAVQNAQNSLNNARQAPTATQPSIAATLQADQVAVENAQKNLANAQTKQQASEAAGAPLRGQHDPSAFLPDLG